MCLISGGNLAPYSPISPPIKLETMNRLISKYSLLLCCIPIIIGATVATKGLRFHTNLTAAKQLAASEGKLYLVDFTAKWCMPCQWMEETTFADQRVINYMKDNYVAVKIDIDDFDGFAYKQLYEIKKLPSILIFNSKGVLLEQYTGSHAPSGLLKILEEHNSPKNRIKPGPSNLAVARPLMDDQAINHQPTRPNTGPAPKIKENKPSQVANSIAKPTLKPYNKTSRPSLNPMRKPEKHNTKVRPAPKKKINRPNVKPAPKAKITTATPNKPNIAPEVMSDEGLFKFTVSRQSRDGFSVQVGVFADYGNVLREVEKLDNAFDKNILVQISKLKTKTVYKVLVGQFRDRTTASAFKEVVIASGSEGMVKDLAML